MKTLALMIILTASLLACLAPIKPIPPIGCGYNDAVLICDQDCDCYWAWVNCNG